MPLVSKLRKLIERTENRVEGDVGRFKVVINDGDRTYYTGATGAPRQVRVLTSQETEPMSSGGLSLRIYDYDPLTDIIGEGEWEWIEEGTRVEVLMVDLAGHPIAEREMYHRAQVSGWVIGTNYVDISCQARSGGMGDQLFVPELGYLDEMFVEDFIKMVMDGTKHRPFMKARIEPSGRSGIRYRVRGSYESRLAAVTDALAHAVRADGYVLTVQWDDEPGPVIRQLVPRNNWTVRFMQPGVDFSGLSTDTRACTHVVWGKGVRADGGTWFNAKYPGSTTAVAPPYPAGSTLFYPGHSVPAHIGGPFFDKLRDHGYRIQSTATYYHPDDRLDVIDLQSRAGIVDDASGSWGPQTWAAAFQPGRGSVLEDGFILPLAAVEGYHEWLYNGDGGRIKRNPKYDRTLRPVEIFIDFGECSRKDAMASARAIIAREKEPLISGSLTLTQDPQEGHRLRVRAGDTMTVEAFDGRDLLLYISEVNRDTSGDSASVSVTVSNRRGYFRTPAEEKSVRRAQRAALRQANGVNGSGGVDALWDCESPHGRIYATSHYPGLGSKTVVAMPYRAVVAKARIKHDVRTRFMFAVFNNPSITVEQAEFLLGGNPLTTADEDLAAAPFDVNPRGLKQAGCLGIWGSKDDLLGYGSVPEPRAVNDTPAAEARAAARRDALLDGTFEEDSTWEARAQRGTTYLTVISWTEEAANMTGRFYPASMDVA